MSDSLAKPFVVDGAEGFLGGAVAEALLARKLPVRAVVADAGKPHMAPDGAEVVVAPIGDADAVRRAVEGARAVVAARKLLEERPREGLTFEAVHAERTASLLAGAAGGGVDRMVYVGVAGITAAASGRLAEAERAAEALVASAKTPAVSLRASLVVGPGDGHVSRMARKARKGFPLLVFVGQGWSRSAPLAAGDFAECVVSVLLSDEFPKETLSIGGPELLTAMEIQDRLLARYGRTKIKLHVPESIARLGALVMEKVLARPPVSRARLAWLLEDSIPDRVTSTKLLGRRPRRFESAFPPPLRDGGTAPGPAEASEPSA